MRQCLAGIYTTCDTKRTDCGECTFATERDQRKGAKTRGRKEAEVSAGEPHSRSTRLSLAGHPFFFASLRPGVFALPLRNPRSRVLFANLCRYRWGKPDGDFCRTRQIWNLKSEISDGRDPTSNRSKVRRPSSSARRRPPRLRSSEAIR